ncbi:PQ loop repeat-domain-containing protein [Phyllosticta citribraziliensis]|uniref:PQ loop repeat-domain-containing protein n=1 Tax=Phyllosticta citribraziliensis TaxID=989973 RepID=A0ABR1L520_9PEZI
MDVPAAANVLGTIGAVCWSIQLIPQIIINYRRHHAIGLQPGMMVLWAWAGVPLGAYNIVRNFNVALQVQPQILTALSLLTWGQCVYYQKKKSLYETTLLALPLALIMGGTQAAIILLLRHYISSSTLAHTNPIHATTQTWPLPTLAALSALLLALGVGRHYIDIYQHRSVRGISFLFVGIDAAGDVFSALSIVFQSEVDVIGIVAYALEFVLWMGVFACGVAFNLRPWLRRKCRRGEHDEGCDLGFGERTGSAVASGIDVRAPDSESAVGTIALHNLPSSTSVFRTPSSETAISGARPRAAPGGRTSASEGHPGER